MTSSQRAIHVHQCEANRRQDLANTQLQQTYPYPQECDWGTVCNRSFTLDGYAECCAHMRSHIACSFDHGGTCKLGECCQPLYVPLNRISPLPCFSLQVLDPLWLSAHFISQFDKWRHATTSAWGTHNVHNSYGLPVILLFLSLVIHFYY